MKKSRSHVHEYVPHRAPGWSTHYACRVCGFAASRVDVDRSVPEQVVRAESDRRVFVRVRVSAEVKARMDALARALEDRFHVRLGESELVEYLVDQAIARKAERGRAP